MGQKKPVFYFDSCIISRLLVARLKTQCCQLSRNLFIHRQTEHQSTVTLCRRGLITTTEPSKISWISSTCIHVHVIIIDVFVLLFLLYVTCTVHITRAIFLHIPLSATTPWFDHYCETYIDNVAVMEHEYVRHYVAGM